MILKGIAWDHPRGYEPLRACSMEFEKTNPNVKILWDIRSLKEFGDMPIEKLVDDYDLITVDHPYMGQANENGLLLPLDEFLSENILGPLEKQSVGPSFGSYIYNKLYALPIDAAAQVAAYRKSSFEQLKLALPKTRNELKEFYKKLPSGYSVIWPMCSVDVICSFLTLGAQEGSDTFIKNKKLSKKITVRVIDELKFHLEQVHPISIEVNPIQALDRMSCSENIIYSPYLFGYTNYSRTVNGREKIIFENSPTSGYSKTSTLLGGVGLAVSSFTKYRKEAIDFVAYVSSAEIQKGLYTKNGGQSGNILAWEDDKNNKLCGDFFHNTLKTMKNAYVRPRYPHWNKFQEEGGEILNKGLKNQNKTKEIAGDILNLFNSIFNGDKKL